MTREPGDLPVAVGPSSGRGFPHDRGSPRVTTSKEVACVEAILLFRVVETVPLARAACCCSNRRLYAISYCFFCFFECSGDGAG